MRRLFARQERASLDRLEGKRGRQMLTRAPDTATLPGFGSEIFDPAFWTATTEDVMSGLYAQVFAAGGARVSDKFGIAFDLLQEGVDSEIRHRTKDLAGQVTDTTYRQIRQALVDGTVAGDDIPTLAGRVREVFAEASDRRATTIARTEVVSAFNGSQLRASENLPTDVWGGSEWISTRDSRTRSAHRGHWPDGPDGQVVPRGTAFQVGGEHLLYPGDPSGRASNTINCRCTIAFLDPEETARALAAQVSPGETNPTAEPGAAERPPPSPDTHPGGSMAG